VKKLFWFGMFIGISIVLASAFIDPTYALRRSGSPAPILVSSHADPSVVSIIERSCQNCHSSNTEWPLYSRIVPFSFMIARDVRGARAHMDLSRWQTYDDTEKLRILSEIGSLVRSQIMPPRQYTLVHPGAKLSQGEVDEVYRWTRTDRRLISHSADK